VVPPISAPFIIAGIVITADLGISTHKISISILLFSFQYSFPYAAYCKILLFGGENGFKK
jgi:hypothetical protein